MPRHLAMPADELRQYIIDNAGKKNVYRMSMETGVASGTITDKASQMQVSLAMVDAKERCEKLKEAITLYHSTHTAREIATMLDIPKSTVSYRAWIMRITLRKEREPRPAVQVKSNGMFNYKERENWLV